MKKIYLFLLSVLLSASIGLQAQMLATVSDYPEKDEIPGVKLLAGRNNAPQEDWYGIWSYADEDNSVMMTSGCKQVYSSGSQRVWLYQWDQDLQIYFCFNNTNTGSWTSPISGTTVTMPPKGTYTISSSRAAGRIGNIDAKFSGSYTCSRYVEEGTSFYFYSGKWYVDEGVDGPYMYCTNLSLRYIYSNSYYDPMDGGYLAFKIGEPAVYRTVTVKSDNETMGTVSYAMKSGYVYTNNITNWKEGSTYTLTATPKDGYIFDRWSDGGAQTHDVTITGNATYTAYFVPVAAEKYTISTEVTPAGYGTVSGAGEYYENTTATLTAASANDRYYKFDHWLKDGSNYPGSETITPLVTADATYTAVFRDAAAGTISVVSEHGTATGAGTYAAGEEVTISVKADPGYAFVRWSDGNEDNPRTVYVDGDQTYTAVFTEATELHFDWSTDNLSPSGDLVGTGSYYFFFKTTSYGADVMQITLNKGYVNNGGYVMNNPAVTLYLTYEDLYDYGSVELPYPNTYTVETSADNVGDNQIVDFGNVSLMQSGNSYYNFFAYYKNIDDAGYSAMYYGDNSLNSKVWYNSISSGSSKFKSGSVTVKPGLNDYPYIEGLLTTEDGTLIHLTIGSPCMPGVVTAVVNDAARGSVTGVVSDDNNSSFVSGTQYEGGTLIELNARPKRGYIFKSWSDGLAVPVRTVSVCGDASYTAVFEPADFVFYFASENITINRTNPDDYLYQFVITDKTKNGASGGYDSDILALAFAMQNKDMQSYANVNNAPAEGFYDGQFPVQMCADLDNGDWAQWWEFDAPRQIYYSGETSSCSCSGGTVSQVYGSDEDTEPFCYFHYNGSYLVYWTTESSYCWIEEGLNGNIYIEQYIKLTSGQTIQFIIGEPAQQEEINYTVRFDGNGATEGEMADQTFKYGVEQALTANAYQKEGYVFQGWSTTADGMVVYTDGQVVSNLTAENDGVVVLYAQWTKLHTITIADYPAEAGTVTVYYNYGQDYEQYLTGSSFTTGSRDVAEYDYITAVATVNAHYTLVSFTWSGEDFDFRNDPEHEVDGNHTIYAVFEGEHYNITYQDQNGTAYSGSNIAELPAQHTYGTPTSLVSGIKPGCTFEGWFTDPECTGEALTALGAEDFTEDITLYAKWTRVAYVVRFEDFDGTELQTYLLDPGIVPAYEGTPARENEGDEYNWYAFTFTGWKDGADNTYASADGLPAVTGDITYTAQYRKQLFVILQEKKEADFYTDFHNKYNGEKATAVTLNRQFAQGKWSTLCLPFNMSTSLVTSQGMMNRVYEFRYAKGNEQDGYTLYFAQAKKIEAGKGYIVNANATLANKEKFIIPSVVINTDTDEQSGFDITNLEGYNSQGDVYLVGTLRTGTLYGSQYLGLKNNSLWNPNSTSGTVQSAYRSFFHNKGEEIQAVRVRIVVESEDGDIVSELEVVKDGIEEVPGIRKVIRNGILYIESNGELFDAQGKRLE